MDDIFASVLGMSLGFALMIFLYKPIYRIMMKAIYNFIRKKESELPENEIFIKFMKTRNLFKKLTMEEIKTILQKKSIKSPESLIEYIYGVEVSYMKQTLLKGAMRAKPNFD